MKGLELARSYYEEFGKTMLEQRFPELLSKIAVGFVGSGSEHFGFDDDISQDHDFEPGFCIFLPGEELVDRKTAFQLERAYAALPKEYQGYRRSNMAPVGGNRIGVIRTAEFYEEKIGNASGDLSWQEWLKLPEYALAEATNGEIFYDGYGEFTSIRRKIMQMPEDICKKRLAGNLLLMAQAGQYNYPRCLAHGEVDAAQMACFEFVSAAMKVAFLLKKKYMPFYKWSFRALRSLEGEDGMAEILSYLICSDPHEEVHAATKQDLIETAASMVIDELQKREMTQAICMDLEKHAYSVNDSIEDGTIRNLHILAAIS